jgi:hypothetical protein
VFSGCLSTVSHESFLNTLSEQRPVLLRISDILKSLRHNAYKVYLCVPYDFQDRNNIYLYFFLTEKRRIFRKVWKETCCSDELTAQTVLSLESTRTNKSDDVKGPTKLGTETLAPCRGATERALALRFPKRQLSCDCAVAIER